MTARYAFLAALLCLFSCKDEVRKSHGPIRLGDSSTIVTETDQRKLQDLVTDLQPDIPPATEPKDTPESQKPQADTAKKKPATAAAPAVNNVPGISAEFEEVSVFIQNVTGKLAGNKNLLHATGAVYTLQSGSVTGSALKITGNVTKVSQRCQVVVVLKGSAGSLPVESLASTTDWQAISGLNGVYRVPGLDSKSLEVPDVSNAQIRKAVQKAAQRRRFSRKKTEEWLNAVRNVHSVSQRPFVATLRSVMWKIDGKDAKGKPFSKQIRIDIPL